MWRALFGDRAELGRRGHDDAVGPTRDVVMSAPPASPPLGHRAAARGNRVRRALLRVYGTLHRWGESGWAGSAVGTWGLLQGSVVPGPSEALFIPLGLADPRRALTLAAWATAGATAGGLIAYLIGARLFDTAGVWLLDIFGVSNEMWESSRGLFENRGWAIVVVSTMSPLSTKLVSIAAGAFGVPIGEFALALLAGRGARFMAIGLVVRFAGERLRSFLARRAGPSAETIA